ncbi:MAG: metallophosphoesterase family protein, partial [Verrucomicrobia bacterium]|nr:metallophosphoesterase family protein [Verrucomicrobiota bacterium]
MVLRLVYIVIALTVLNTVIGAQLIEVGSELRYFPVEPGAAAGLEDWYMPGYDDTGWDSGASGIGYMKGFTATRINEEVQEPPCSILLRKRFIVDDVKVIEHLLLRVEFTGGFIAYLNGREITRHGLDVPMGSGVPFTATADYVSGGTVEVDMNEYISLLEPGINYLCLQLQPAYSGAAFGATPELSANLSRGPYLQNTTVDSVKVVWKSIAPAAGRVEFGMDRALNNVVVDGSPGTNHVVSLTNLEPDTVYYYRVVNETDDIEARSEVFSFRTFKESGALTFMVLGDSGEGSKAQYNIAEVIRNEGADLIVHLGDLVYPYYHRDLEDVRLFSVYRDIFTGTPFFSALGNHEMYVSIQSYFDAFDFPADSSGTEAYYSFDHGDAHFVVLDTESKVGEGEVISSEQLQWLEGDLAAATAKWKFLFFHKPARSSGLHRFDDYNLNGKYDYVEIQNVLDPLIKEYGVQAVFNAHDHDYERLGPVNGSVFVVSGGGGGPLYSMSERDPASV